jgi:hypothetical protein
MSIPVKIEGIADGVDKIASHTFSAVLVLWGLGEITKQNIVDHFGFDAQEEVELDQLQNHYQGLNSNQQLAFHGKIESLCILLEEKIITQAKFKQMLGIS